MRWVDGDDPYGLVSAVLGGAPVATAVTDSMPALHMLPLADALGVLPVLATDVLRRLRMVKEKPRSTRCVRPARRSIECMPECRSFWSRAERKPT